MPFMIFIIGIISAAGIWYWRMQSARENIANLADAAKDVRLAARRFGFKRQTNIHPADSVDDPRLAAAGILHAVAGMADTPSDAQRREMLVQFQSRFECALEDAQEISTFGAWLAAQCGTKSEAVRRLSRRLAGLAGYEAQVDLRAMILAVVTDRAPLGEEENQALATIERAFPNA